MNRSDVNLQSQTNIILTTQPDPIHYILDSHKLVSNAIENRMEMLELELQLASDASKIDYYKNQALPLASVDYTYNVNGLGATNNSSYYTLYHKNFEDHRLGLSIVVPLGNANGLRQNKIAETSLNLKC